MRVRKVVVVVVVVGVVLVGVVGVREEDAESSAFLHDATAPSGGGATKGERSFRSAPYTLAERACLLRDKADKGVPQRHGARLYGGAEMSTAGRGMVPWKAHAHGGCPPQHLRDLRGVLERHGV